MIYQKMASAIQVFLVATFKKIFNVLFRWDRILTPILSSTEFWSIFSTFPTSFIYEYSNLILSVVKIFSTVLVTKR